MNNTAPAQAEKQGFSRLTFFDDFNEACTFDMACTGNPGYKWYLDRPFDWSPVEPDELIFADSILTINPKTNHAGWGPCTFSVKGNTGNAFRYGYFEAKLRFDPALAKVSTYFPAWWSFSAEHSRTNNDHWGELDFFEAMPDGQSGEYNGAFINTVHEWIREDGEYFNHQNPNNYFDGMVKDADWHVYGCLWKPGRIEWYLDEKLMAAVDYGAGKHPEPAAQPQSFEGCYTILDKEEMLLILGTGKGWPLEADWVRVWQK